MGLPQTRYASTSTLRRGPQDHDLHQKPFSAPPFAVNSRLRTALVMNDELVLHGLMHVASRAPGLHVVGHLQHGNQLVERLRALRPDLLVMAVAPRQSLAELLRELDPTPRVIVIMESAETRAHAVKLLRDGADALVDRRSSSSELLATITKVAAGHTALDALSANAVIAEIRSSNVEPESAAVPNLTRREREVLNLLTEGLDNRSIARQLFVSEATVKFHLHNIMEKFGIHKRAALVSAALRGRSRGY